MKSINLNPVQVGEIERFVEDNYGKPVSYGGGINYIKKTYLNKVEIQCHKETPLCGKLKYRVVFDESHKDLINKLNKVISK